MTPETDTILQQAFGLALSSRFASGAVSARYRTQGSVRESSESELILCNLSVRRDLFLSHGGFDERLYPNEENELLDRMRLSGVKLLHDPDLAIRRSQRKSLRAFVRQIFGYGRGRGRQTFISRSVSLPTLVPFFFLLYLLSFTVLHNPVYYIPLCVT
jgi:GT2 family glycosyltransferase